MNSKILLLILFLLVATGLFFRETILSQVGNSFFSLTAEKPQKSRELAVVSIGEEANDPSKVTGVQVVAEGLSIPWAIAFLPDQTLLVTERPGNLVRLLPNEQRAIPVSGVEHAGEGGLLGMAIHPDFETNHWLYLYHTTRSNGQIINRVERHTFDDTANVLRDQKVILDNIPASTNHDGGRIVFGPDKLLYISTGDAQNQNSAQDRQSLAGKILRLNDDGSLPDDNPFGTAVYSYGHRNPQGLSWDGTGQLWSTEHGPSGTASGFDEVNLINPGANYGWPIIQGDQTQADMTSPVIQSGSDETWAPGDVLVVDSILLFTGLRGQALYSADITGETTSQRQIHWQNEYGRLRSLALSPDGEWIYLTTSNTDGRGRPAEGDDKILRFSREWFFRDQLK